MTSLLFILSTLKTDAVRLEAELGSLTGATVAKARPGYSGTGYVTGFAPDGARVKWKTKAKAGVYEVKVGFSTPGGKKGFEVGVNGQRYCGMFPDIGSKFGVFDAGKVELKDGDNEISIERGWGYFDLDYVELKPAGTPAPLKPVPNRLQNPRASVATKKLFTQLVSAYGRTMLSGQYDLKECDFIRNRTGENPLILGGDFMDYSPSRLAFGANPKGATESYIAAAKRGQVLTLSWHWNAPKDLINKKYKNDKGQEVDASWYKGFYTEATTFNLEKELANPKGEGYRLLISDIDRIAVELKKLAAADVPVLWRPLHEAEGGWFWWGAKGPKPCKQLWKILRDRLEGYHHLNNLIWVWNSANPEWYPGDGQVDIVSIDSYPSDHTDPMSGTWEPLIKQFNGKKMLALAEFPGAPDVDRMFRFGVRWAYFVSWTGSVGPSSTKPEILTRVYRSPRVITQAEWKKGR